MYSMLVPYIMQFVSHFVLIFHTRTCTYTFYTLLYMYSTYNILLFTCNNNLRFSHNRGKCFTKKLFDSTTQFTTRGILIDPSAASLFGFVMGVEGMGSTDEWRINTVNFQSLLQRPCEWIYCEQFVCSLYSVWILCLPGIIVHVVARQNSVAWSSFCHFECWDQVLLMTTHWWLSTKARESASLVTRVYTTSQRRKVCKLHWLNCCKVETTGYMYECMHTCTCLSLCGNRTVQPLFETHL